MKSEVPIIPAKRLALGLAVVGSMIVANGCGDSNPVDESPGAAPPPTALTADRMKEARQKAFGASGEPKVGKGQGQPSSTPKTSEKSQ